MWLAVVQTPRTSWAPPSSRGWSTLALVPYWFHTCLPGQSAVGARHATPHKDGRVLLLAGWAHSDPVLGSVRVTCIVTGWPLCL